MPITNGTREGSIDSAIVGMENGRSQSVLVSMHGKVARSRTAWSAGYRWQPTETMTSVDAFNTGLSNPFLSLTIHQPLPCLNASQNASQDRLVLLLEMRNILAQGYRPIYIVNGHGAYFAQAARALTGGLAFSF